MRAASGGPRAPRHPSSCRRCTSSGQGQSRDERARCATSRSSETGSGHESSGSAWIDWKVRVCAMRNLGISFARWGSQDPGGGGTRNRGIFPRRADIFSQFFFFGARLRFVFEFSKILGKGNPAAASRAASPALRPGLTGTRRRKRRRRPFGPEVDQRSLAAEALTNLRPR